MKDIPLLFGGHPPPAYDPYETDSDFEAEEQPPPAPPIPSSSAGAAGDEGMDAATPAAAAASSSDPAGGGVKWTDPEQRKAFLKRRAAALKAEVRTPTLNYLLPRTHIHQP